MTTIDHKKLRELAEAATPGPWMRLFGERTVYDRMNDGCRGIPIVRTDNPPPTMQEANDLDFIAAANPQTILALLDEIEAKRRQCNQLKSVIARAMQFIPEGSPLRDTAIDAAMENNDA